MTTEAERLIRAANAWENGHTQIGPDMVSPQMLRDAAAEIESLKAQVEALSPRRNVSPTADKLVLHKMCYYYWEADGDDPADFELFDAEVKCDACIDVYIVRADKLDAQAAEIERLKTLSVTSILLDVTPGDGSGFEVYAKSVADVENKLTQIGSELEDWELGIKRHPAWNAERDKANTLLRQALEALNLNRIISVPSGNDVTPRIQKDAIAAIKTHLGEQT